MAEPMASARSTPSPPNRPNRNAFCIFTRLLRRALRVVEVHFLGGSEHTAQALEVSGDRFALKILSEAEFKTWKARSARWPERGVRFLATRFSAKEAFSKAIGLGMRMPMAWRLCEVGKLASGKPVIVLHGVLKDWCEARGLSAQVSVTDETDYAASFVVVEQKEKNP